MPPYAKPILDTHHQEGCHRNSAVSASSLWNNSSSSVAPRRLSLPPLSSSSTTLPSDDLFRASASRYNSTSRPISGSCSTSSSTSNSSTSSSSVKSLAVPSHFGERLAVIGSIRALLLCLERNGISSASIEELRTFIQQKQFLRALERAQEYVECILVTLCRNGNDTKSSSNNNNNNAMFDLDALIALIVGAWTALASYSKCRYQDAYQQFTRQQNGQWEEFIVQQRMSAQEREARKRRRLSQCGSSSQQEHDILIQNLNTLARHKIDCEKGLILTKEWSRYLRAQRKEILAAAAAKTTPIAAATGYK